jgi:hypothetical protein
VITKVELDGMTRVCTFADGHTQHEAILDYAPATRSYRSTIDGGLPVADNRGRFTVQPAGSCPLLAVAEELARVGDDRRGGLRWVVPELPGAEPQPVARAQVDHPGRPGPLAVRLPRSTSMTEESSRRPSPARWPARYSCSAADASGAG